MQAICTTVPHVGLLALRYFDLVRLHTIIPAYSITPTTLQGKNLYSLEG